MYRGNGAVHPHLCAAVLRPRGGKALVERGCLVAEHWLGLCTRRSPELCADPCPCASAPQKCFWGSRGPRWTTGIGDPPGDSAAVLQGCGVGREACLGPLKVKRLQLELSQPGQLCARKTPLYPSQARGPGICHPSRPELLSCSTPRARGGGFSAGALAFIPFLSNLCKIEG